MNKLIELAARILEGNQQKWFHFMSFSIYIM